MKKLLLLLLLLVLAPAMFAVTQDFTGETVDGYQNAYYQNDDGTFEYDPERGDLSANDLADMTIEDGFLDLIPRVDDDGNVTWQFVPRIVKNAVQGAQFVTHPILDFAASFIPFYSSPSETGTDEENTNLLQENTDIMSYENFNYWVSDDPYLERWWHPDRYLIAIVGAESGEYDNIDDISQVEFYKGWYNAFLNVQTTSQQLSIEEVEEIIEDLGGSS